MLINKSLFSDDNIKCIQLRATMKKDILYELVVYTKNHCEFTVYTTKDREDIEKLFYNLKVKVD